MSHLLPLHLGQSIKAAGYRLTAARRAILEVLVNSGGHLSADELAEQVQKVAPGTGRMTVYRTLETLCQLGIVRPVYQGTGAAHYILMQDGHHHHLICDQCHVVIDFDDCLSHEMTQAISQRHNFQIHSHLIELYGRCSACLAAG